MDDKILFGVAAGTALIGLILLWLTAPPPTEGYRLIGVVAATQGGTITVTTNVTVVTRSVKVGSPVNLSVFWADDRFIAPRQSTAAP